MSRREAFEKVVFAMALKGHTGAMNMVRKLEEKVAAFEEGQQLAEVDYSVAAQKFGRLMGLKD